MKKTKFPPLNFYSPCTFSPPPFPSIFSPPIFLSLLRCEFSFFFFFFKPPKKEKKKKHLFFIFRRDFVLSCRSPPTDKETSLHYDRTFRHFLTCTLTNPSKNCLLPLF
eukprot:TRINITY_DN769_c3_g1_i1.p1 TRINITY_DN769_c3_g1~~TRINITY_DN769_c3_g1_i1.p1  ORF type:complete len:108 (-),score=0.46 TRINITY_DN769_c3_g1_i1:235-558(-)